MACVVSKFSWRMSPSSSSFSWRMSPSTLCLWRAIPGSRVVFSKNLIPGSVKLLKNFNGITHLILPRIVDLCLEMSSFILAL